MVEEVRMKLKRGEVEADERRGGPSLKYKWRPQGGDRRVGTKRPGMRGANRAEWKVLIRWRSVTLSDKAARRSIRGLPNLDLLPERDAVA